MNDGSGRLSLWRERGILLLILAAFLCGLPGIFAIPAEWILFNPQAYKDALAEQEAYQQFPALLGEMIAGGGNVFLFGSGDRLLGVLQKSNYEMVVRQIFPEEWVRAQAYGLIDQFWAYFNFEGKSFRLVVDLRPVKARMNGDQAGQIAANIVAGFPPCSSEEILAWGLQALQGSIEQLPLCRPPEPLQAPANLLVEGLLRGSAGAMPDQFDLAGATRLPLALGGRPVSAAWERGFTIYRFYRQVDGWLPWAALGLLVVTAVLARGTQRGALYWLGVGLLLPGFAALVFALLLGLWSSQVAPFIIGRLFGESQVLFQVLVGMLSRVTARFMVAAGLTALVVALLGTALVAGSIWLRKRGEA